MNKLLKAIHQGELLLEDGTRVIGYNAVFKAFGRTRRGTQTDDRRVRNMPAFLNANNLQPFVGDDLKGVLNKIDYLDKTGKETQGFNATILPMLCKVYLDARAHGVL